MTARRVTLTVATLASLAIPSTAQACGLFDSSCKNPTISVHGQVFIAVLIVLILGGVVAWRIGRPRALMRALVRIENRRTKRAARRPPR